MSGSRAFCKFNDVWDSGSVSPRSCSRVAVRGGFCSIHHPEEVGRRQAAQKARDAARWKAFEDAANRKKAAEALAAAAIPAAACLVELLNAVLDPNLPDEALVRILARGKPLANAFRAARAAATLAGVPSGIPAGKILAGVGR